MFAKIPLGGGGERNLYQLIDYKNILSKRKVPRDVRNSNSETRQVQERMVSTLDHMQVPKVGQDQVSGEASPVGMPHPLQVLYGNQYLVKCQIE